MKLSLLFAGLMTLCVILSSCSISKTCYGDGVCKVTKNGVSHYEGPPDLVAKYQQRENQAAQASVDLQKKYDAAPKRGARAASRVALFMPTAGDQELEALKGSYYSMIKTAFERDPKIQVVDQSHVQGLLSSGGSRFRSRNRRQSSPKLSSSTMTMLRDKGIPADVVVFIHLKPKAVTGYIKGKGGAGLAQVQRVEFQASFSSVYRFKKYSFKRVGKSSNSFAVAGFNKKKQYKKGQMKFKRRIQSDQPAIAQLANLVRQKIKVTIAPKLPTMAALSKIRPSRGLASGGKKTYKLKEIMNMFKKK